jgi:hypothetical protein
MGQEEKKEKEKKRKKEKKKKKNSPSPKRLALEVKQDAKKTPQQHQRSIRHNGRHEPSPINPIRNILAIAITPEVFVDRDGNEKGAGNGFVRIDGVGGHDGWDRGDLHAGSAKGNHDNDLPGPFVLHAECCDNVANVHDDYVGNECDQTHLGLVKWKKKNVSQY